MQNDMRDRLVNLIIEAMPYSEIERQPNKLADYLIANGVIVPPCKVGDTVYYFDTIFRETEKCKVYGFSVTNGKIALLVDNGECKFVTTEWYSTKDQAEQKLKEVRVENGNL